MVKKTRDESYYWAAFHKEKKMHKALNGMKDKLENRKQKPEEKEQKKLFENE
jgi:ERCC4-related helicase